MAVAKSVDQFLLLGQSADDAPGEVMDKVRIRELVPPVCFDYVLAYSWVVFQTTTTSQ